MGAGRVARGILIGGSLGVFAAIFGITDNMFISVGFGMLGGFLAGLRLTWRDKHRK